jgi:prophage DNA circulation protein
MQFKNFVFPNNPTKYCASFRRNTVVHDRLDGLWTVQEMGRTAREFSGEGVFFGKDAYKSFKALAQLFYAGGAGALVHPQWATTQAHLVELTLDQEPREDYVHYRFKFLESAAISEA